MQSTDIPEAIAHCSHPYTGLYPNTEVKSAKKITQILGADLKVHAIYQCYTCKEIIVKEIELE
jgi:hypothetical protein